MSAQFLEGLHSDTATGLRMLVEDDHVRRLHGPAAELAVYHAPNA
jgi:hypothetical protein